MIIKEAAELLYQSGKTVFTRKELTSQALKLDPSRSEASLDFEIDLVTVNSYSKERYRDPDKLFLYRIDRGKYTLYNPEIHGDIQSYIYQKIPPVRKSFINYISEYFQKEGYMVEPKQSNQPLTPHLIIRKGDERIGVWIVDPMQDNNTQLSSLAFCIGACLLNRSISKHIIVVQQMLLGKIPSNTREYLLKNGVNILSIREEKRYIISGS